MITFGGRHEHHHHTWLDEKTFLCKLDLIIQNQLEMAKSMAELAQELRDLKAQNEKSRAEVLQKFADLEAAIANAGNTTPEVDDALAELKASIQTDDDLIADAPPPEEPPV